MTIQTHEDFGEDRHLYVDGFIKRPEEGWQVQNLISCSCWLTKQLAKYLHRTSDNQPKFTITDALGRKVLEITLDPAEAEQTVTITSELNSVIVRMLTMLRILQIQRRSYLALEAATNGYNL